jgi:hypothetical protein
MVNMPAISVLSCPYVDQLHKTFLRVNRGAQKLTGDNLKVVWAKFSTLSQAILLWHIQKHAPA